MTIYLLDLVVGIDFVSFPIQIICCGRVYRAFATSGTILDRKIDTIESLIAVLVFAYINRSWK